jgi:FMN phosphatase YigB (HAD superfamily)
MRETYEHFRRSAGAVPDPAVADRAAGIGRAVFDAVPLVRDDAREALERLRQSYRLVLFTAGDAEVQRHRIDQTGLGQHFDAIYVTPQKSDDTWCEMIQRLGVHVHASWSVGNSVRSDINPALRRGLRSIVVAGKSWEYERASLITPQKGAYACHATTLTEATHVISVADGVALAALGATGRAPVRLSASLLDPLREVRQRLEPAFAPDTAFIGSTGITPSAGHCAAVAAIVHRQLGGELLSTNIDGESHWFNRLEAPAGVWDVDLTGDQFGRPPVQAAPAGELYVPIRVRPFSDLRSETLERAARLATRAGLEEAARALQRACVEAGRATPA